MSNFKIFRLDQDLQESSETVFLKNFIKELDKKAVIVIPAAPVILDRNFGIRHLRLGVGPDPIGFFKDLNIKIRYSDKSLSGSYETFDIRLDYNGEWKWFYFVNRVGSTKADGIKKFTDKDLIPKKMGITGQYTSSQLKNAAIAGILNSRFDKPVKNDLVRIVEAAYGSSEAEVDVSHCLLNSTDLKTVSKNLGEILAGFWLINAEGFKKVDFPEAANYPLVDLFAINKKDVLPVSVKSGGGSVTSMKNVKTGLDQINKSYLSKSELKVMEFLYIVINESVKEGAILAGKAFGTKSYKLLQKATGLRDVNFHKLINVIENQSIEELKKNFKDLYAISSPDDKSFEKLVNAKPESKVGLVIGPYITILKNEMNTPKNLELLNKILKLYQVQQLNVDVKLTRGDEGTIISYKKVDFKDAKFHFECQAAATTYGRNRFGFKMT